MLRRRRHRAPEKPVDLDLGDGKSPERRRADARRAHYEHQQAVYSRSRASSSSLMQQPEKSAP